MMYQAPKWLPWLCPVCAIIAAVAIAYGWPESSFWSTVGGALVASILPVAAYRLWQRLRPQG